MLNSIVSTPKAKCLIQDISNFYLNNDLLYPEVDEYPNQHYPSRNYYAVEIAKHR